jgi:MraZ protein
VFYGESTHSLDAKHRVFIPKRFLEVLGRDDQGNHSVVLTRGFERCLFLFSSAEFEAVRQRLRTKAFGGGSELRKMQRLFFSNTHVSLLDGSGRLVLPEKLRQYAGIQRDVVMIGCADRAEIWSQEEWQAFERQNEGDFDALDGVLVEDESGPEKTNH